MSLIAMIPMRLGRGLNDRENHFARARRVRDERAEVSWAVFRLPKPELPCVIRITRIAPSSGLDDDNLSSACKAVRDEIAAWIGVNDRESHIVRYEYAQERGPWGVRIEVVR